MPLTMVILNNAGDERDNPVVAGLKMRVTLSKHDAADALKHCWVTVAGEIHADLTSACVEEEAAAYVDVTSGVELKAETPPVLNVVHFTTATGKHAKVGVWVAEQPPNMIELNGYNADDPAKPLIVPFYVTG